MTSQVITMAISHWCPFQLIKQKHIEWPSNRYIHSKLIPSATNNHHQCAFYLVWKTEQMFSCLFCFPFSCQRNLFAIWCFIFILCFSRHYLQMYTVFTKLRKKMGFHVKSCRNDLHHSPSFSLARSNWTTKWRKKNDEREKGCYV